MSHRLRRLLAAAPLLFAFGAPPLAAGAPAKIQQLPDGVLHDFAKGNPVDLAWLRGPNPYRSDDRLLVLDSSAGTVSAYTPDGVLEMQFGAPGSGPGQLASPMAIATYVDRRIFVADTGNDRIQVFDAEGGLLRSFGTRGSGPGQLRGPRGIAIARMHRPPLDDAIVVADTGNDRIQVFTLDGEFVSETPIPMPLGLTAVGGWGVVVTSGRDNALTTVYRPGEAQPFPLLADLVDSSGLKRPVDIYKSDDFFVADASGQILAFEKTRARYAPGPPVRLRRVIAGFGAPPRAVLHHERRGGKASVYVADGHRVLGLREVIDDPLPAFREFRARLAAGDADGALAFIHPISQPGYREIYARLGPEGMAEAAARIRGAEVGELREERATVYMHVHRAGDEPTQITSFPMRWVREPGGRWLIVSY